MLAAKLRKQAVTVLYQSEKQRAAYFGLLLILKNGVFGSGWRKVQQLVGRQLRVLFNDT